MEEIIGREQTRSSVRVKSVCTEAARKRERARERDTGNTTIRHHTTHT